jgi:signal transduction histidine kinase/CheY-like chemotaxis protein/HAMP domain-containing protein
MATTTPAKRRKIMSQSDIAAAGGKDRPRVFRSIRARVVVSFCLLFALILATVQIMSIYGIPFTEFEGRKGQRKVNAFGELDLIADTKKERLLHWLRERRNAAHFVAANELVEVNVAHLLATLPKFEAAGGGVDSWHLLRQEKSYGSLVAFFEKIRFAYGFYESIRIADAQTGRIFVSTRAADLGADASSHAGFKGALSSGSGYVSDMELNQQGSGPFFYISDIIKSEGVKVDAVLLLEVNAEKVMKPMLHTGEGMGKEGEVILVNRNAKLLTALKHPLPGGNPAKLLEYQIKSEPALKAAKGENGAIEAEDYRGIPVLAAYRYISISPDWGWGMIVKIDRKELLAPLREYLDYSALLGLAGIAAVILFAIILSGNLTRPILSLSRAASRLGSGDLSVRCGLKRDDEIGTLSSAFDSMADTIQESVAGLKKQARELKETAEALETRQRVQENALSISGALASSDTLDELLEQGLDKLMRVTRSQVGAVYLHGNGGKENFRLFRASGIAPEVQIPEEVAMGQGALGLAAQRKTVEVLRDIPPETRFTVKTVGGESLPNCIVNVPLVLQDRVVGVVALASLYPLLPDQMEVVEMTRAQLATAITNARVHAETLELAEALREKNEELATMNEELQSQSEELKSQTDQLEAQRARLRETDRLKSEFLSNMSHELRTPLNSIMALSQLMINRGAGKTTEREAEYLRVIERNGRHLLNLINDILDLSKIEAGRIELFLSELDPRRTVLEVTETMRPLCEKKGLALKVQIGKVPVMHSDGDKLRQILLNLLSNAIKFTEQGKVEVLVSAAQDTVSFVVRDTGIGIAQAEQPHIFDEFRQVDGSSTRRHEGTGLGLAICRKLTRLLGGEITVQSEVGQGSNFTLTLPIGFSHAAEPQGEPIKDWAAKDLSSEIEALETHDNDKNTILVIDDEGKARNLLKDILTDAGYHVTMARNGKEGLRLALETRPSAITLDILMPEMDGWEVLRELKASADTAGIPVIIVSVSEDRLTGMALGAAGFVVKPVERSALLAEIEKLSTVQTVDRILVVDDDPVARDHLRMILGGERYRVETACGGEEALVLATADPPDVMVLDLMMPDVDGFTVIERLRRKPATRDLPVIILTAKDLTSAERSRLNAAAQRVIAKGSMDKEYLLHEIKWALAMLQSPK